MRHANKTKYATESGRETSTSFESRNPATGELLATYPEHNKAEIDVRLQRAWDGWRHWSRTPLQERFAFLTRLHATESGRETSMSFESRNPATGELLGTYPEHNKAEIEVRLQRAWDGWRHWSRTPLQERIAFLTRLAELLEERAETYGRLITAEMGKPVADSIFEIKKSAWAARHLAEVGEAYLKPQPIPGLPAEIIYESLGPIFSVQPWNVPFWQVLRFFNTTAFVGNTAIIKHAESVQGCAEALETLVRDAGGPEGLYVNLAIPVEACAAVITDPRVRAVTVTGSVRAGRAVAEEAARVGKRAVLELGGSDPFIVLEDADLAKAVQLGVTSRYFNNSEG